MKAPVDMGSRIRVTTESLAPLFTKEDWVRVLDAWLTWEDACVRISNDVRRRNGLQEIGS